MEGWTLFLILMLASFTGVTTENQCHDLAVCMCNKNSTAVDCKGKHLLSVPELLPKTVKTLHLERNDFTNISTEIFKRWPNIQQLWLDHNKISQIEPFAFKGLDFVRVLDLRSNQIKILLSRSFAGMPNLEELYLTTNKIHSIEENAFEGTISIKFISFQANKLLLVPAIGYQPALNYLVLEGNSIANATIPYSFKESTNITSLVLSNNKITALEKDTFKALANSSLNDLKLARNKIHSVDPETLAGFRSIKILKIGDNALISVAEFTEITKGLVDKNLQSLDISALDFGSDISKDTFQGLKTISVNALTMKRSGIVMLRDHAFRYVKDLHDLDLSANEIGIISDTAFSALGKLTTLKLSGNRLSIIPKNLPSSLHVLYLDKNLITKIDAYSFQNLSQLKELRLNFNAILTLVKDSFDGLYNLNSLDLSNNNINTLPGNVFEQFVRLKFLNLAKNKLTNIQESNNRFASMHSLEYLNLADNQCSFFQRDLFQPLLNLKYLHLEENNIGNIISDAKGGGLFSGLSQLLEVHLMKNNITEVPGPLFRDLTALKFLNISHNGINKFGSHFVNFSQTNFHLDLSYNHITSLNNEDLQSLSKFAKKKLY